MYADCNDVITVASKAKEGSFSQIEDVVIYHMQELRQS